MPLSLYEFCPSSCSSSSVAAIAPFRKNGEDIFSEAVLTSAFDNKQYNNE